MLFGAASTFVLGGAFGFGIAKLLGWLDWRGSVLIVACASAAVALAIAFFFLSDERRRREILHMLTALWFGYLGLYLGGFVGSLIGRVVGGEVGQEIGWCALAAIASVVGTLRGWRYSHRLM